MAWPTKTWYDAPNPLTPLSAAAMQDLETRIAAAVNNGFANPDDLQEGVVGAGDLKCTTVASGLTITVPTGVAWIADDVPTYAAVAGDLIRQRRTASGTVTCGAAHATLPRIDQVIATSGGYGVVPTVSILAGTATSGATLANRTGATALPNGAVRLADVLVPAAFTGPFVDGTHIRDRRPWARGFSTVHDYNATVTYTSTTSAALVDGLNLVVQGEFSGGPVEIFFSPGELYGAGAAAADVRFRPFVDGASMAIARELIFGGGLTAAMNMSWPIAWQLPPGAISAGYHVIGPAWSHTNTATQMLNTANIRIASLAVREYVLQDATNSGA